MLLNHIALATTRFNTLIFIKNKKHTLIIIIERNFDYGERTRNKNEKSNKRFFLVKPTPSNDEICRTDVRYFCHDKAH